MQLVDGWGTGELQVYRASLAIAERLAAQDPTNAASQRDLWVSCWRMADIRERNGDAEAQVRWRRAHDTLAGMKRKGLHPSPEDQQYLAELEGKIGR